MTILIHASLDFRQEMIDAKLRLEDMHHIVLLPELTRYQHIRDVEGDDVTFTSIKNRLTLENFRNVEKCDAILILNYTHRGIKNYVGGNSFMEMVVGYYLGKKLYLMNQVPDDMPYTEEIKSLYPVVIDGDFSRI